MSGIEEMAHKDKISLTTVWNHKIHLSVSNKSIIMAISA